MKKTYKKFGRLSSFVLAALMGLAASLDFHGQPFP
jgi:hypothetical protein